MLGKNMREEAYSGQSSQVRLSNDKFVKLVQFRFVYLGLKLIMQIIVS